ncbi:SDR family NAD(P)-dependent oxidoreductase [Chromobacterium piscinae]|uniref:SDR family NAD(P)-dependent oxidoreductase n=1 Tax=Chromobacterium piscinae TaxID=686831 RepID=UPI003F7ECDAB
MKNDFALDREFNESLCGLLACQLQMAGVAGQTNDSLPAFAAERGLPAFYARWLEGSLSHLVGESYFSLERGRYLPTSAVRRVEEAWPAWEARKTLFFSHSNYRAKARLAEEMLRALPEILAGEKLATEVMFPHSSMERVEGVYKNNDQADFYNNIVAETVASRVRESIGEAPSRKVRILEIGAGTGGTSAVVLEKLSEFAAYIDEYGYTDLSTAFLRHAEREYAGRYPFIKCHIFDAGSPPEEQGLSCGSYDIVLATNVLHATKNIRNTLQNAKRLLVARGMIVISELSQYSLFAHVTFGLLEAWWSYDDAALRIPGCPALYPQVWQTILAQEGFKLSARPEASPLDSEQQVFVAESDGMLRRRQRNAQLGTGNGRPSLTEKREPAQFAVNQQCAATGLSFEAGLKEIIRGHIGRCLCIAQEEVIDRKSFADYGLDSITAGQLVHAINTALNIQLKTTILFDHSSVNRLSEYLLSEHQTAVAAAVASVSAVFAEAGSPSPMTVGESVKPEGARIETSFSGEDLFEAAKSRVKSVVRQQLCACLHLNAEDLGQDGAFADYGLDSITAGQFTQSLNRALDIELKTTVLFQHSSIERLSRHILERFADVAERLARDGAAQGRPLPSRAPDKVDHADAAARLPSSLLAPARPQTSLTGETLAVVGMSGRFAQSNELHDLWEHLANGADLVQPVTRWNLAEYFQDRERYCNHGSFLDDIDKFDPAFFNISGVEASWMDPQQRVFLEECWKALEDAGYAGIAMQGRNGGVYVGCGASDYRQLFSDKAPAQSMWGNASSIIPARIAYYLDLQGAAISVDTACSSSLVAIHLACQALLAGEIDFALAGGVSIQCTPDLYTSAGRAEMLSASGRCYTLDERADGFVPGEGAGVVVLKRLSDAVEAGDHVYAVIRGSGINQDGTSNGITAPSAKSQEQLECWLYEKHNVDPEHIQMVEMHGTGTKLGDPIEFDALARAFRKHTAKKQFCAVGSIKSNIGHTTAAAGVAGLLKILLSLKHKKIPPSIHFKNGNSHIDFENSPFYVNTALTDWVAPPSQRRMAALSSFGFSGTNAHMLVEEAPPIPRRSMVARPGYLIALSAETPEQLYLQAQRLAAHCRQNIAMSCGDVSFTLLTGRRHLRHRLSCIAASCEELNALLTEWSERGLSDRVSVSEVHEYQWQERQSDKELGKACIKKCAEPEADGSYHENIRVVAELYMKGYELDYAELFIDGSHQRVPLPTYPFARESYWIPQSEIRPWRDAAAPSISMAPRLHALVHEDVSIPNESRYSANFDGTEFFLRDHVIGGRKLLPGAAYLEMARAAAQLTLQGGGEKGGLRLRNIIWGRPLMVEGGAESVLLRLHSREPGRCAYEIGGLDSEQLPERIYSRGWVERIDDIDRQRVDLDALKRACSNKTFAAQQIYDAFASLGIEYGPGHRAIAELHVGGDQIVAKLVLPSSIQASLTDFVMHPSLLDAALQTTIGFGLDKGELRAALPFSMEDVRILARCEPVMWAHVTRGVSTGQSAGLERFDLQLFNNDGLVCVDLKGFIARASASTEASAAFGTLSLHPVWIEEALHGQERRSASTRHIVLLCELEALSVDALQARLPGAHCVRLNSVSSNLGARFEAYAIQLLQRIQQIFASWSDGDAKLQVLIPNDGEARVLSGLAGMLKTAKLENPGLDTQLIELDATISAVDAEPILVQEFNASSSQWVRYEGRKRSVCVWEAWDDSPQRESLRWKDGGVYLITGGTGGLGRIFAEEICRNAKSPTVILVGRSHLDAEKERELAALKLSGGGVSYRQVDIADELEVFRLMQHVRTDYGRLDGIIHSAGMIRDSFIVRKNEADLAKVLAPKVRGLINLDEASRDFALDVFILFSAGAAVFGNPGQADYAAANGFMDAFAEYRNALAESKQRHGRALAINWPLWQDGGMRVDKATERAMRESVGALAMPTANGIAALYRALGTAYSQVLVLQGDRARLQAVLRADGNVHAPALAFTETPPIAADSLDRESLAEHAVSHIKNVLSAVIGVPLARLHADAPMEKYGIDSIMVMQLTTELEKTFGPLSKTLFFEYRSIRELAAYFLSTHLERIKRMAGPGIAVARPAELEAGVSAKSSCVVEDAAAAREPACEPMLSPPPSDETNSGHPLDIAIIGVAGRYPQADDLSQFWRNLREGKDCISEIPGDRWDHSRYFDANKNLDGKTYSKWGGFIHGVDRFDPLFFNISPREAELMDPQERLFLQCAHEVLEDAGYTRDALAVEMSSGQGGDVGVFVGVMYEEYQLYGAQRMAIGKPIALTGSPSSIANRVSYFYNFHGPSMAVDTMCSSSLTAIHLACQSILSGECEAAIAGGVNVSVHPNKYLMLAQGSFASSKGRCESFGKGGDGYVPGEGVGAVMLKPRWKAERDGDHIYGIIRATAINHGGKTSSYSVPNPNAQSRAIYTAIAEAGIDPRAISYIEAHGTGTSLGDPIEIAGLTKAFREFTDDNGFCAIGSVKSNIGHCESAAGISGITKVLLQMQHRELVPSLHSSELNPYIDFENSPFVVQRELADWKRPVVERSGVTVEYPRVAGISSFGAGGGNAHVILEEYVPNASIAPPITRRDAAVAIVLSARNEGRLRALASKLLAALPDFRRSSHALSDMAYTLQLGREAMEERLAVIVVSVDELEGKLQDFIAGRDTAEGLFRGRAQRDKEALALFSDDDELMETIDKWFSRRKYKKLLALWIKGLDLDWTRLYAGERPRRVSLPSYPFETERYWVSDSDLLPASVCAASSDSGRLHPLLHRNTSSFAEQRFTSVFKGDEFFLKDHVVRGRPTLPAVAYLEMAYAAMGMADGAVAGQGICIKDVAWAQPAMVEGWAVELHIRLTPQQDGEAEFEVFSSSGPESFALHGQGHIAAFEIHDPQKVSLGELRQAFRNGSIEASQLYQSFRRMGIDYGPGHQAVDEVWLGHDKVMAKLSLPSEISQTANQYVLHPAMLDAALQASLGLILGYSPAVEPTKALLPFSIESVEVFGACTPKMWVVVAYREQLSRDAVRILDADLYDSEGELRVRVRGLCARVLQEDGDQTRRSKQEQGAETVGSAATTMLAPSWEPQPIPDEGLFPAQDQQVLVIGGYGHEQAAISQRFRHTHVMRLDADADIESITVALGNLPVIDHVFWIAPDSDPELSQTGVFIADQERGVIQCFRMAKALLLAGYEDRALGWTFITCQAQAVNPADRLRPSFSSLCGFAGSLAKEFANWRIRLLDLQADVEWPLPGMFHIPADPNGDVWAWRGGVWYRQLLLPSKARAADSQLYKARGVYVVIGGAGGIGECWSEYMIRNYDARIVWIGRKPMDATLQAKIDRLAQLGEPPLYLSADASDGESLAEAYTQIKLKHDIVNGIIHSAIVLSDKSIARMSEESFRSGLAPKVNISAHMAHVFRKEPLDFVLFFSSMISFSKAAGQSNYASGCTFKDVFARRLAAEWPCAVKIMNWGFWGSVGAVALPEYLERMEQLGVGSLQPEEGMEALNTLLNGPINQLAFIKTTRSLAMDGVSAAEFIFEARNRQPSLIKLIRDRTFTQPSPRKFVVSEIAGGALSDDAARQPSMFLESSADYVE